MIDRRHFIRVAGAGIAMVALATEAQQVGRLPRIGVLLPWKEDAGKEVLSEGFRELGYVERRTAVRGEAECLSQHGPVRRDQPGSNRVAPPLQPE